MMIQLYNLARIDKGVSTWAFYLAGSEIILACPEIILELLEISQLIFLILS